MIIELNLMGFQDQLRVKHENDRQLIFDSIRHKWLVLQPEELVRQLLVQYLLNEKGYSKNKIALEKLLIINNLERRYDILVYNADTSPFMLIECKAPNIDITDDTFRQIAQYNLSLNVPYLLVTNGIKTYCCRMDYTQKSYEFLPGIPNPH
ncbi:MAG: type I restriction enzyme HsdR N-terminal domain-containing protein [Saprospiraceae bacterium]|nr:type I restriction enzyme HsdR N-terminal domain-containing protein [Saprospiraceae bacterium]